MLLNRICLALALLLALLLALTGAAGAEGSVTFFAMDTVMAVSADGVDGALLEACEAEALRLEALFSVTRPDSDIARLNADGAATLSDDTAHVLTEALRICGLTGGALDVTLYPVVRAWGFTGDAHRIPGDDELATLLAKVDWSSVAVDGNRATVPEGVMVDLGAVAKGYASDRLAALLREGGADSALIDLGGNIYCVGAKPDGSAWRVGVRDPLDTEGYVGALAVRDRAVITSGSYERYFVGDDGTVYGHIFDPATGRPADSGVISATIVGENGLLCDALSTALYVLGVEKAAALLPRLDVDALLVDGDGGLWLTPGLRDIFTPMGRYKSATLHWMD